MARKDQIALCLEALYPFRDWSIGRTPCTLDAGEVVAETPTLLLCVGRLLTLPHSVAHRENSLHGSHSPKTLVLKVLILMKWGIVLFFHESDSATQVTSEDLIK